MPLPAQTLIDLLLFQSVNQPDKLALEDSELQLSYHQWYLLANCFSHQLQQQKPPPQARVLLYLDNCCLQAPLIFGALMARTVFVVISTEVKGDKLVHILNDAEPFAVVTQANYLAQLESALDQVTQAESTPCRWLLLQDNHKDSTIEPEPKPESTANLSKNNSTKPTSSFQPLNLTRLSVELLARKPTKQPLPNIISEDLATLIYTSGSTGMPKAIMHNHRSMLFACQSICEYLQLSEEHRLLNFLPLSFDYGLYQLFLALNTGAYLYILNGFTFPQTIQDILLKQQISVLPAVPTSFTLLNSLWRKHQFPQLQILTSTGEDLLPTTIELLKQSCPNAQIFKMYGLTECKRVSFLPPQKLSQKPKSVGQAIPGTRAYILKDNGEPAKPGETGLLYVEGNHLMLGYWKAPERNQQVLHQNPLTGQRRLCTGDRFTIDQDGDLYFAGRNDNAFKIRGIKANPDEIENCLLKLPEIDACAALVVEQPRLGSQIAVFIQSNQVISPQLIKKHCQNQMEAYLLPRIIKFVDSIPRNQNGKVDRRQLQDWLD